MKRYFIKGTNQEVKISDGLSKEGLDILLDMGAVVEVNVDSSSEKPTIEFGDDDIDDMSKQILDMLTKLQVSLESRLGHLQNKVDRLEKEVNSPRKCQNRENDYRIARGNTVAISPYTDIDNFLKRIL